MFMWILNVSSTSGAPSSRRSSSSNASLRITAATSSASSSSTASRPACALKDVIVSRNCCLTVYHRQYKAFLQLILECHLQTMVFRPNLQAYLRLRWSASWSPEALLPASPSCFPTCCSPCVATSSRCAEKRSSTDTSPSTPPSISIVSWL